MVPFPTLHKQSSCVKSVVKLLKQFGDEGFELLINIFFSYFSLLGFVGQQPIEKIWKCEPTGGTLKWGTIIPLIGGSSIGCSKSAGNLPAFHLTYTPFKNNEAHLERYWPKVPKYYIDKDQQPENMTGKSLNIIYTLGDF